MKTQLTTQPAVTTYTLTLSEEEAISLALLAGVIAGNCETHLRKVCDRIYYDMEAFVNKAYDKTLSTSQYKLFRIGDDDITVLNDNFLKDISPTLKPGCKK